MNADILANLVITKVHSVSTLYTPKNKKLKRNDRERWAVVIKYEGETVYTSNGKRFISDIGHIVILPKGCSYDWQCTRSGHFSIIEFESEKTFEEPFSFSVKNGEKILKMLIQPPAFLYCFQTIRQKYFTKSSASCECR